jgi:lactate permease
MMFLLALLPIVIILLLMVGFQWRASRAGSAGYLTALLIGWLVFQAGIEELGFAHSKAVFLIFDVLYIIWPAYLLFKVVDEAGGIAVLGRALPFLTRDRGMQALLIGWIFASFLQGVGGFGVPVAVIAPLFVGLGFSPLNAVVIPSLGHSWAITFGSLGSSFNAMMAATGLSWDVLAGPSALMLGASGVLAGYLILLLTGGWAAVRRLWLPTLIVGGAMAAVQYLTVTSGLWNIGGLSAGSAGLLVGIPLAWFLGKSESGPQQVALPKLLTAVSGYIILVALTLIVQLVPQVHEFLGRVEIGLQFPALTTGRGFTTPAEPGRQIVIFRHAGTILLISAVCSWMLFRAAGWYQEKSLGRITGMTITRMLPSSVGIASMVMMAVIMQQAGMIETLARGVSSAVSWAYPGLAPWLGALGAFMTGSNTNSNLVMSVLQMRTAEYLSIPAAVILAGQTAGAALGSVISPTKVIIGASTAELSGREGEVMRSLLLPVSGLILLISGLTFLGIWLA